MRLRESEGEFHADSVRPRGNKRIWKRHTEDNLPISCNDSSNVLQPNAGWNGVLTFRVTASIKCDYEESKISDGDFQTVHKTMMTHLLVQAHHAVMETSLWDSVP